MQTPWGDLAVSDSHVHFFSQRFFTLLGGDVSQLGWEVDADLAARWVNEMDRHGLTRASIIASLPGDEESVADAARRFPDRFYSYFLVNPTAAGWEKGFDLGLDVPCLFPAMHRYPLYDERVLAVLDRAKSVFIHCGVLSVGVRKRLGLASNFDMRFSNPLDVHALALRYPAVNFVLPHFGAGFFREARMLCDLCPNVYLDTSSTNSWMKYQDQNCDLKSVFARASVVTGAKRLLFGTDSSFFPRGWNKAIFDSQVSALYELGIGKEDAQAIFSENLRHFIGR